MSLSEWPVRAWLGPAISPTLRPDRICIACGEERVGPAYREIVASGRVPGGLPIYGDSHLPPDGEREQIRQFIAFLADRSALVSASPHRHPGWMVESAKHIRDELHRVLGDLPADSLAVPSLRIMRVECEKLLMHSDGSYRKERRNLFGRPKRRPPLFWIALGGLRSTFGLQIAVLCVLYGIDLHGPITTILPATGARPAPHPGNDAPRDAQALRAPAQ